MKKSVLVFLGALILALGLFGCGRAESDTTAAQGKEESGELSADESERKNKGKTEKNKTEENTAEQTAESSETESFSEGALTKKVVPLEDNDDELETEQSAAETPLAESQGGNSSSSSAASTTVAETDPEETNFFEKDGEHKTLTWEEFQNLSAEAKDVYLESFGDYGAFTKWMLEAQAAYVPDTTVETIGDDGVIHLDK